MPEYRQGYGRTSGPKALLAMNEEERQRRKALFDNVASTLMDLTPGVGIVKGVQEMVTGRNVVEDRLMSPTERVVSGAGAALWALPGGMMIPKSLTKTLKAKPLLKRSEEIDPSLIRDVMNSEGFREFLKSKRGY